MIIHIDTEEATDEQLKEAIGQLLNGIDDDDDALDCVVGWCAGKELLDELLEKASEFDNDGGEEDAAVVEDTGDGEGTG